MSVKHLCRYLRRSPPSPAAMASNPGTVRKTFPGGLYFGGDFASNYRTGSIASVRTTHLLRTVENARQGREHHHLALTSILSWLLPPIEGAISGPRCPTPAVSALHQFRSVLGQLALALKMAAISASDISSGCFLVCSLRSIHNPASLACAVVAVTMAAG